MHLRYITRRSPSASSILSFSKTKLDEPTRQQLHRLGLQLPANFAFTPGENLAGLFKQESPYSDGWFSIGLPRCHFQPNLSPTIFWSPYGLPTGSSLFIASSRLGRNLAKHSTWFNAFRTLTCRLQKGLQFIVTRRNTTADRFVKRASELFAFDVMELLSPPKNLNAFKRITKKRERKNWFPCYHFPIGEINRPHRDDLLIEIAKEVRLLNVRHGGNVHSSIMTRCGRQSSSNVFLLSTSNTSQKIQTQLMDAGCHRWILIPQVERGDDLSKRKSRADRFQFKIPIVAELPPGEFLIHCTRPQTGPWPDQDENRFLDDLIFQSGPNAFSVEASLTRILAMGCLHATNRLTRSDRKVVCFTEVQFNQLPSLKTFRPHLSRWDFLSVGIAIRKTSLQSAGAEPVIYGDESTWSSLSETERPFFQVATTQTKSGNTISWNDEKEWRIVGDLNLDQFGAGEIFAIRGDGTN